jgi:two-component system sensor histidine kinase RegB
MEPREIDLEAGGHPATWSGPSIKPPRMSLKVGALRVSTALSLRLVVVVAQTSLVLIATMLLSLPLPISDCIALIAAAAFVNVAIWLTRRRVDWLSERETTALIAFDVVQLSLLVAVTGGLANPFALMLVAPTLLSAMTLGRIATLLIGAFSILSLSLVIGWHGPPPLPTGVAAPEALFQIGVWTATTAAICLVVVFGGRIAGENRNMADALVATHLAVAREHHMTSLGALAAAAAHELGSPLGTISVIARELANEVTPDDPLREDVDLLLAETERCRQIMGQLAQRPDDADADSYLAPSIVDVIETLIADLADTRVPIQLHASALDEALVPRVARRAEVARGIASYLRNATQFARGRVTIAIEWSVRQCAVAIEDDGPGFAPAISDRLGEPWLSTRRGVDGHLGLGVFIAETLLGRSGATVTYGRATIGGARVAIRWPRTDLPP